jgi:hypothetical protein
MTLQANNDSAIGRPARLGLVLTPHSTIALTSPPWITSVVDRLGHLFALAEDWDGEGARPLDFDTAMEALNFLLTKALHETPAPQLIPTSAGGLQLEWHCGGSDLEITFEPGRLPTYFYVAPDGSEIEDAAVSDGGFAENSASREDLMGELIRKLPVRDNARFVEC